VSAHREQSVARTQLQDLRRALGTRRAVGEVLASVAALMMGVDAWRAPTPSEILRWEKGRGPGDFWQRVIRRASE